MKKTLCIVLAILMLTAVFMGCSKKAEDEFSLLEPLAVRNPPAPKLSLRRTGT